MSLMLGATTMLVDAVEPEPDIVVFTLTAAAIPSNFVGFSRGEGGTVTPNPDVFGFQLDRLITGGGPTVIIVDVSPANSGADLWHTMTIEGPLWTNTLIASSMTYGNSSWSQLNVLNFAIGSQYEITIYKEAPP